MTSPTDDRAHGSTLARVMVRIVMQFFVAISIIAIVTVLANVLRPENAVRLGSGFTSVVPAVYYPVKLSLMLAAIYFGLSFLCRGALLAIAYAIFLLGNLVYLFSCIETYVS